MGKRHDGRAVALELAADAFGERTAAEQAFDREAADGDDQGGAEEAELPVEPERAELSLPGRRRAVARARGRAAGVTAHDGSAVERGIEGVLVEVEPAAEGLARAAAPRAALAALDDSRRLAVHVRALALVALEHGQRLEAVAGLGA